MAKIGFTGKAYFIADIAANHDGDLNRAFRLIELAKEAGADAAKFQNFTAESIVSRKGFDTMPKAAHQAAWQKSVYEVYADASIDGELDEAASGKVRRGRHRVHDQPVRFPPRWTP